MFEVIVAVAIFFGWMFVAIRYGEEWAQEAAPAPMPVAVPEPMELSTTKNARSNSKRDKGQLIEIVDLTIAFTQSNGLVAGDINHALLLQVERAAMYEAILDKKMLSGYYSK